MALRYALHVPSFAEPGALVDLAVAAERHGWDGYLLWDHILGFRDAPVPVVDSWVVLGAIARATSHIRIGTAITPVPRRRPWKLAREVTTVDRLSGGRSVLGVGLGNPVDAEYGTFGEATDLATLAGQLDEGLTVIDGLMRGEPVTFSGLHYQVDGATFLPRPIQTPRVPVWVACTWPHRRPLERAARWDGAIVLRTDGDELVAMDVAAVAEIAARVRVLRRVDGAFDLAVVMPGVPADPGAYEDAGVTWLLVTGWLDDLPSIVANGPPRREDEP